MTQETDQSASNASSKQALDTVHDTLSQFLSAASVDAVYGEPLHEGDMTVIPCAEVLSAIGFGIGQGYGSQSQQPNEPSSGGNGGGGGGGGGGRILSRPVAALEISANGVTVKPIIDVTKLAIAGITTWGFMLTMMMRMGRKKR